jgi:hypothetical protein
MKINLMYTKLFPWLSIAIFYVSPLFAQVKIGGAPGVPVSSAVLELDGGGNRALRLPIINSKEQLGDVANPVNGLIVYGSHTGGLIYYHNGAWFELNSSELGFTLPHTGIYEATGDAVLKLTNNGTNGNGIHGISSNAVGVLGVSGIGTGVMGNTADGFGVDATSVAGIALRASSQSGTTARFSHGSNTGSSLIVENGRVGIGTLNPATGLHINLTDFAITGVENALVATGGMPVSGIGKKMAFSGTSGALRAGVADATNLGNANVGYASIGLGVRNIASNNGAFASGWETKATGAYSSAMSFRSEARGNGGFAAGNEVIAYTFGEIALGIFNTGYIPQANGNEIFNPTDRLFVLGNGTADNARSNAMVVLKNGNVGIGNNTPAHKLVVNGDVNLTAALRINGDAGTNGQVLTSTGTGLMWSNAANPQTGYHAMPNSSQTIAAGNTAVIDFSKTNGFGGFNEGGGVFNIGFLEYEIPSAGVYQISVSAAFSTNPTTNGSVSLFLEINKNSPPTETIAMDHRLLVNPHSNTFDVVQAGATVKLAAGVKIKARVLNETNGNVVISNSTSFPSSISITKVY